MDKNEYYFILTQFLFAVIHVIVLIITADRYNKKWESINYLEKLIKRSGKRYKHVIPTITSQRKSASKLFKIGLIGPFTVALINLLYSLSLSDMSLTPIISMWFIFTLIISVILYNKYKGAFLPDTIEGYDAFD